MHYFKTKQFLPINITTAWEFFSNPANLSRITPPELDFKIISKISSLKIYEGMSINYKVKPLWGISVGWETVLKNIKEPQSFTDIQTSGPYKQWEHKHSFRQHNNGVWMQDEIKYKLPLGFVGRIFNFILVRKKIESIFLYRENVLNKLFNDANCDN
ncbi:MAG: SRPBCC family protein [Nitrosopumilus sp.]|nr:SRPBCC family protein [Nitrosopumilus sp.]